MPPNPLRIRSTLPYPYNGNASAVATFWDVQINDYLVGPALFKPSRNFLLELLRSTESGPYLRAAVTRRIYRLGESPEVRADLIALLLEI